MDRGHRRYLLAKRALDLALCVSLLPAAIALGLLITIAVAVDSRGPILFGQRRTGRDGTTFRMLKFRTMVRNAEELKPLIAHLNVLPPPDFKVPNDPRITRVGRFLRWSGLDELPQILNVLAGSMSFVGPRPTSFRPATYDLWQTERLEAPPGITGAWQIRRDRNTIPFDERVRIDVRYVRERSLLSDLRILVGTVRALFIPTGM